MYRFWFLPEKPYTMAIMRIGLCAYLLADRLRLDLAGTFTMGRWPTEFHDPSPVLDVLPIPFPLPAHLMAEFRLAMMGLGILATVGFFTRPALLLFGAGYWYMGAVRSAWGLFHHELVAPVQVLAVLAIAPGTSSWSVDRLLIWIWRRHTEPFASLRSVLAGPPVPRWGTKLILVLLAALFLSSGVSKLRHGGLHWVDGKTLGFFLAGGNTVGLPDPRGTGVLLPQRVHWYGFSPLSGPRDLTPQIIWKDGFGLESYLLRTMYPTELGLWISRQSWALVTLSVLTLVFELSAPVLLMNPLLRNLYLISAIIFLLGIRLTMPVGFILWIPVLLFALDWPWLIELVRRLAIRRAVTADA